MARIARMTAERNTNDAFSCLLPRGDASDVTDSFYTILSRHDSHHCLDIGTSRTLSGMNPIVGVYSTRAALIDIVEDVLLSPAAPPPPKVTLFGSADTCFLRSDRSFGVTTDPKSYGDGVINAYDIAVLLWSQFERPPYNDIPDLKTMKTVDARETMMDMCCSGLGIKTDLGGAPWTCLDGKAVTRSEYSTRVSREYCDPHIQTSVPSSAPTSLPTSAPTSVPSLAPTSVVTGDGSGDGDGSRDGRRLDDEAQVEARRALSEGSSGEIRSYRWADVGDAGSWTKIELPETAIALELFLLNVDPALAYRDISFEAPPPSGCSTPGDDAGCEPDRVPAPSLPAFARTHCPTKAEVCG